MPEIRFTIDDNTGDLSMKIVGVKGKACKPIHNAVSADLKALNGITELSADDTPELHETERIQQTAHVRQ